MQGNYLFETDPAGKIYIFKMTGTASSRCSDITQLKASESFLMLLIHYRWTSARNWCLLTDVWKHLVLRVVAFSCGHLFYCHYLLADYRLTFFCSSLFSEIVIRLLVVKKIFFLWLSFFCKTNILKNVGSQTSLAPIDVHCIDTKQLWHFLKYILCLQQK